MPSFTLLRDRDASDTIRGYVYQVDLTIERWLNLQPGQILELERGEDIDIVSRSLTSTPAECQRLLEQVKHRDSSITLRNPGAVTAIACFVEHRQTNRGANLLFRFTTNTKIGRERPSPIPKKTPAIEAWEQIRDGSLQGREQESALQGIHTILKNVKQPDKLDDDTWQQFRKFITTATNSQLLDLICSFEWSANAPKAQSLSPKLQKILIDHQHARDDTQAQEQYQRLFLYVFKLLCKPDIKRLTVEERRHQLSLPTLSENDHHLLNKVVVWVHGLESRVGTLEQGLSQTHETISLINTQVQYLAREQDVYASINYTVATPILDIQPLVEHPSYREQTVNALIEIFTNHTWVAIHGSVGSGKTQLASLLVQSLDTCRAWEVRLRDLTIEQACVRLDVACEALVALPPQSNRSEWFRQICEQLGDDSMLVLDDLPRLSSSDELSKRLIYLARACSLYGVRLLSTSPYPLPISFRESLGGQILHTMKSPPFSDTEVTEVLRAYGAPPSIAKFASFINILARQHPLLLAAIAQYLHRQNWRFTEEALEGLFKSEYTAELNNETIDRLLATIEDTKTRELLYRLNLVGSDFSLEDMRVIAAVNPVIEQPHERLNTLIGIWVQRDVKNRLLISPLVQKLGSSDLPVNTQKTCHLVLGDRLVRKRQLSPLDVMQAVIHFGGAEAFERAGTIMILALKEMNSSDVWANDGGLLYIWSDMPLPDQMSLNTRLLLRGVQVAVHHKYGRSISYLVEDLDALFGQASEKEASAVILATLVTDLVFSQDDPRRVNRYLRSALQLWPQVRIPNTGELLFPDGEPLEVLIWTNLKEGITSADHLRDWITTVEHLTVGQRQRAFTAEVAEAGCLCVSEDLYYKEKAKPRENQQWHTIFDVVQELADRSRRLELKLLWACAVRIQIAVLGTHLQSLDAAVAAAEAVISQASNEPRIQLLIGECMGRQYVNANCYDVALIWLNQALDQASTSYPTVRLDALLSASRAAGPQDRHAAIQYAQQAVSLAESSEEISENNLVRALGELAIARWLADGLPTAFEPWEQAGERLFACRTDTDDWKELFLIYGHVSGYFAHFEDFGSSPATVADGSPYDAPERGIFFNHRSGIAANYDNSRDSFLASQLARFAEAIGEDEQAATWALRGIDMARAANQLAALPGLCRNATPHLLLDNRYAEVLDFALEAGAILVAAVQSSQAGGVTLAANLDVEAILGPKPSELWRQAERNTAIMGLFPVAFRLSTVAIRQPDLARTQAADVAAICREISAIAVNQQFWTTAAELLEQIYSRVTSFKELINRSNAFAAQDDETLWAIGYLGITFQDDATPKNVLLAHLYLMRFMYRSLKPSSATYCRIVLPFLSTYWTTTFERMRFRFRSPQMIERELSEAQSIPKERRAQSILRTIAYGLGITPPTEFNQWLQNG